MPVATVYKANCKKCRRLASYLKHVKKLHPDDFCQPVPAFGAPDARLLIVGLAPGLHGANATGRPFTGDASGDMLYRTLYEFGFASAAESRSVDDGLKLTNCLITNAVKCLPPDNKPVAEEINNCNRFLMAEVNHLADKAVIIALGSIAHNAVLKALGLTRKSCVFAHQSESVIPVARGTLTLLSSYHCSRYNTQTGRLTQTMFNNVFSRARQLLSDE